MSRSSPMALNRRASSGAGLFVEGAVQLRGDAVKARRPAGLDALHGRLHLLRRNSRRADGRSRRGCQSVAMVPDRLQHLGLQRRRWRRLLGGDVGQVPRHERRHARAVGDHLP